jgi:hypothetical protein
MSEKTGKVHELKTWPVPFAAVLSGEKRAEMRRNDRGFEVGDRLVLLEYVPPTVPMIGQDGTPPRFTGRRIDARITHVLRDSQFGIHEGFAMLSIEVVDGERCTGITARWCPRCGDCKCTAPPGLAGDMDSPDCPLHALNSTHGEETVDEILDSAPGTTADEHQRLADAVSEFIEAIDDGWYGDMPAAMRRIAEAWRGVNMFENPRPAVLEALHEGG